MDNSCGCCRKQMPEGDTWCCEDKCGLLTCPDCRPDDDTGACVICQQEDEDKERCDGCEEDCESVMSTAETPKNRHLCPTCYSNWEDEEMANRTPTSDSDDEGEDLKCAECLGTIVYNSPAHDNALTHDGIRWWCLGCSAAWERALKEDEEDEEEEDE